MGNTTERSGSALSIYTNPTVLIKRMQQFSLNFHDRFSIKNLTKSLSRTFSILLGMVMEMRKKRYRFSGFFLGHSHQSVKA